MKEIGSEFYLNPLFLEEKIVKSWSKYFPKKKQIFLSSGRDSLVYAIRAYKIKKMLIPSYIEEDIIKQILKEGIIVKFYNINKNLNIDLEDVEKKVKNFDSILIIHYFGFPHDVKKIQQICKENNLIMVEDCVQSMLSSYDNKPLGSFGEISFNSLRKFIGIPDGSILTITKKTKIIESTLHKKFVEKRINALIGKYLYLNKEKSHSHFYFKQAFIGSEKIMEKYEKPAPISTESLKILQRIDFSEMIKIRRQNFIYLLSELESLALYKKLPTNVCPLGFPIIVKDRNKIKKKLIENKIYPPIHWPLSSKISKSFRDSWKISSHILTIPIDQRYNIEDMERIIEVLRIH